ncbi:hypothetical protein AC1031_002830 [Aphanomyces cochlioides]|nr:hypothetical protein AC1031_002830 [Aphanomyces cochlioides]
MTNRDDNGECDWDECPGYTNVDMHYCKNGCPKRYHHVCAISMGNDERLCIVCSECLVAADDRSTGKEMHQRSQRSRNWSDEATIKLLHLRFGDETIRAMFNSTRYGHDQRNAWEVVAKKLGNYSGKQCKERVKTCIAAYNKATIPKTGNERVKTKSFFGVLGEYLTMSMDFAKRVSSTFHRVKQKLNDLVIVYVD